jgi:hypothetical protein
MLNMLTMNIIKVINNKATYESHNIWFINLIKLLYAMVRLNNMTNHSDNSHLILKLFSLSFPTFILIWW